MWVFFSLRRAASKRVRVSFETDKTVGIECGQDNSGSVAAAYLTG